MSGDTSTTTDGAATDAVPDRLADAASSVREVLGIIAADRLGLLGLVILVGMVGMAVFAPVIAPYDPMAQDFTDKLAEPSLEHPAGTDDAGRDILSQAIYASRPALIIGLFAALLVTGLGTSIGVVAGYFGGWIDDALMRLVDFTYGIPLLPTIIIIVTLLQTSMIVIILGIAIILWRGTARVVRSRVLTLKQMSYVKSARAVGASDYRIMVHHILPNVLPLTVLYASFAVGWAILTEANVSFLGFGDPNLVTWGRMLLLARQSQALLLGLWWWFLVPGLMIMLLVVGVFMVGRAYEEAINPEIREAEV
jgi:peptide/nickel transport system permease protein